MIPWNYNKVVNLRIYRNEKFKSYFSKPAKGEVNYKNSDKTDFMHVFTFMCFLHWGTNQDHHDSYGRLVRIGLDFDLGIDLKVQYNNTSSVNYNQILLIVLNLME